MKTAKIGLKEFRKNIGKLAKKGKEENIVFYITSRNTPVGEFRPCFNENSEIDDTDVAHLHFLEKDLSFWNSDEDEDIFETK